MPDPAVYEVKGTPEAGQAAGPSDGAGAVGQRATWESRWMAGSAVP